MKAFIKGFVYSYLGLSTAQSIFKIFVYLDTKSFWLVVLAFALLNIFKRPILAIVSLPIKGPLFYIFSMFLSIIMLNILLVIVPDFSIMSSSLPGFNILGYVVASKYLSPFLAGIAGAVTISLTADFFYWLASKKGK